METSQGKYHRLVKGSFREDRPPTDIIFAGSFNIYKGSTFHSAHIHEHNEKVLHSSQTEITNIERDRIITILLIYNTIY